MADELRFVEEFPVTPAWLHQQLPVALSRARFGGLTQGVLPLGRWAFGNPGAEPPEDPVTVLIVARQQDQIGEEKAAHEILENVGTQVTSAPWSARPPVGASASCPSAPAP